MNRLLSYAFPQILWSRDAHVHFTFDDGPDLQFTPRILDVLKQHQCKASFFLVGEKARALPEIVVRIAAEGHTVGLHGYHHQKMIGRTRSALTASLQKSQEVINSLIGSHPIYFRPPYGWFTPRLIHICHALGLRLVMWDIMSYDYDLRISDDCILRQLEKRLKNGSIVVFHDGHVNSARTIQLLPPAIKIVQKTGMLLNPL